MDELEKRLDLADLSDFYAPLLTERRQEILRLYCEEDLSLQEIADQMHITRQGVSDAVGKAREQLMQYESRLGLLKRYRALERTARVCEEALSRIPENSENAAALCSARTAIHKIIDIER